MNVRSTPASPNVVKPNANDAAAAEPAERRPYTSPSVQVHRLDEIVLGNNGRPFDATMSGAQGGPGS